MYKMRLIVILLVIFSNVSASENGLKSVYTGIALNNGFTRMVTFENEESLYEYDLGSVVERCDDKIYYCITSSEFTLVLPKKGIVKKENWNFNGIKFSHRAMSRIQFLDKSLKVHLIISDQGVNFLFSEEFGLAGYIVNIKNGEQFTMLLSNLSGVGSNWFDLKK